MIGKTISHYKILEKLGEGGMGVVYKAEDTKLKRTVALKFLSQKTLVDSDDKDRFLHEAQAAAALSHPNICHVYEIDEIERQTFIAMEFTDGRSLKEMIDAGPLSLKDAVNLSIQIAEGMQEAHENGIVHRDIKPANVMLTSKGQVKIMDFGLAMSAKKVAVTQEGTTLGTFAYMSPEQTRGDEINHRTDIWSLGVVLYEMLAGQRPFKGDYEQAVVYSILNVAPEPVGSLRAGVPLDLERIVDKALAKDPDQRYQNLSDMLVDLRSVARDVDRLRDRVGAAADAGSGGARGGAADPRLVRTKRTYVYAALAIVVASVLAVRLFVLPGRAETIDSIAVLPIENLSGDPEEDYFADGMTEALIADLAKISALRVISRTSAMRYKDSDKSLPQIASELNVDAIVEGSVVRSGDRVRVTAQLIHAPDDRHLWADVYERDLSDVLTLQGELARAIAQEIRVKLSPQEEASLAKTRTVDPEVYQLYLKGRYLWNTRTDEGMRKGLEYFQQAIQKDPTYAPAYSGLADSYIVLAGWGLLSPDEATPKIKAAAMRALELDHTLAEAHVSLGLVKEAYEWDWSGAENEYKKAIQLNPAYPTAYQWYALLMMARGRADEALALMEKALELDPLARPLNLGYGYAYLHARRYDKAIEQFRRILEFDPTFYAARGYLGEAYVYSGRHEEGIAELEKAVEDSGDQIEILSTLGHAYAVAGRYEEARAILEDLKRQSESAYVPAVFFAVIHVGLGEKEQVLVWLDKACEDTDYYLSYMLGHPVFDPVRDDPRFVEIMRRVGLEQ